MCTCLLFIPPFFALAPLALGNLHRGHPSIGASMGALVLLVLLSLVVLWFAVVVVVVEVEVVVVLDGRPVHLGRFPFPASLFYRFGIALVVFCLLFPFCHFSQRSILKIPISASGATLRWGQAEATKSSPGPTPEWRELSPQAKEIQRLGWGWGGKLCSWKGTLTLTEIRW